MYIKLIIVKATGIFIVWGNPKRKKFFHWDKYMNIFIYIHFIILIIFKCTILYSMVPVHFPRPQWNPCTYKHPLFMFTSPAPATTDLSSWIGLFWTFPIESQYVAFCNWLNIILCYSSISMKGMTWREQVWNAREEVTYSTSSAPSLSVTHMSRTGWGKPPSLSAPLGSCSTSASKSSGSARQKQGKKQVSKQNPLRENKVNLL